MDLIPKIVEKARVAAVIRVRCQRPERMAKELRRHLPNHDIGVDKDVVVIRAPNRACSAPGPTCIGKSLP